MIADAIDGEDGKEHPWYSNFKIVNWIAFFVGTLFLLISYTFTDLPKDSPTLTVGAWSANLHSICKFIELITAEAGTASYVALGLNLSTEWVNRLKHEMQQKSLLWKLEKKHTEHTASLLDQVRRKLLQAVYERTIPEELFSQVDKHLLNKNLIRKSYKASYTISKFVDEKNVLTDFVQLEGYYQYTLVNISPKALDTFVRASIDLTVDHEDACRFTSVTIGSIKYSCEDLLGKGYVFRDEEGKLLLHLSVPVHLKLNDDVQIYIEFLKLGHRNYSEAICVTDPTTDLELEIVTPHKDFLVEVDSLHPEEAKMTSAEGRRSMMTAWKLDGVLPGQGIYFSWRPDEIGPHKPLLNAVKANADASKLGVDGAKSS